MAKIVKAVPKLAKASRTLRKAKPAPRSSRQHSKSKIDNVSKHSLILGLLKRGDGASISEIRSASGWQAHSIRGFLSGTIKKRDRLALQSKLSKDGTRRYFVAD